MPDIIWQTLSARGLSSKQQCDEFLYPKLKDLRNPLLIADMQKAVIRLKRAYIDQEPICVYGDFDLDGTSGVALLKKGFELLGFQKVIYHQPLRLAEGYGVHINALDEIVEKASLVITVDVGITANEAIEHANKIGLEVIITDHHLPGEKLPDAFAVVNPNRKDCQSGLGHLSGVGVGFFLLLALRAELKKEKEFAARALSFDPKELLDCFVIGTLTDLVPVRMENRVLIKHGLITLEKTQRPGLRRLLAELGLAGRPLTSQDVAIRFAPKINALSRMEKSVRAIDLFLEEDDERAKALVVEVIACNQERIQLQAKAEKLAAEIHAASKNSQFIWVASKEFHRGVVGLVATKLSKAMGVPAFIGAIGDNGDIIGSSRLPDSTDYSLLEALESVKSTLVKFGGHREAAGFEIEESKMSEFEDQMRLYWSKKTQASQALAKIYFDAKARLSEITPQFMKWYDGIGPFGTHFEVPQYLFVRNEVVNIRVLRGGHLKLTLRQVGMSKEKEALWFSPSSDHSLAETSVLKGKIVDVIAEPQWNYFAGRKSIQLLVKDLRESRTNFLKVGQSDESI